MIQFTKWEILEVTGEAGEEVLDAEIPVADDSIDQEKWLRSHVVTVGKKRKFLLNQQVTDLYIAENVLQKWAAEMIPGLLLKDPKKDRVQQTASSLAK